MGQQAEAAPLRRKANQRFISQSEGTKRWPVSPALAGIAILLVLVAGAVLAIQRGSFSGQSQSRGTAGGAAAPDFSIKTADGGTFSLAAQRGHPVALYFMASWCSSCVPGAQSLARAYSEYRDRGLQVLAVDVDPADTLTDLARFRRLVPSGAGDGFSWALDQEGLLLRLYNVRSLDTTVLIDRQGRLARRSEVPPPYGALKQWIEEVL